MIQPIRINKTYMCYSISAFVLFLMFILFLTCVNNKVEQNEYAVIINNWSMQFHGDVLTQGVYILNPGDNLIKFKRTLQGMELGDLECLTEDEVMLSVHVSIQFQYVKEKLVPIILKKFGTDKKYKEYLWSSMRSSILGTCLKFTALEYYEERGIVDGKIYTDLTVNINSEDTGSTIEFFQLVDIKYPQDYINVLHQKQNIKQNLITAENNRETAMINANTILMETERQADINIINAKNYYDITIYSSETQVGAITNLWSNRAQTFFNIMQNLNLSIEQFLNYLSSDVVRTSQKLLSGI